MDFRPHIKIRKGLLEIGGINAKTLAETYGTPLYVTDLDRVVERYKLAFQALTSKYSNSLIAFAYKSNSMFNIVQALSKCGAGGTVVSGAGLTLATACDVDPQDVVFDGPSKSREELTAAIRSGVRINAESTQEVLDIESLCSQLGAKAKVGLRINFGILAETYTGLATGSHEHKFGIARQEAAKFCRGEARRLKRIKLDGLHSHVGSQITDMSVFRRLTKELVRFADELGKEGVDFHEFNFGGGLGIDYGQGEGGPTFEAYADATAGTFSRLRGARRDRLVFELGRSLVADSTILLTRVNYLKRAGAVNWALVDAGMNDFIRPALYSAQHLIVPANVQNRASSHIAYSVGGPVCETTDVFGADRRLGVTLSQGDLLAILDSGAYGLSMASTYNMRPIPRAAVVSHRRHHLSHGSSNTSRRLDTSLLRFPTLESCSRL